MSANKQNANPQETAAAEKPKSNAKLTKVRILVAHDVNGKRVHPNQVVACDDETALSLVESGVADDSEAAVKYALSLEDAKVITITE